MGATKDFVTLFALLGAAITLAISLSCRNTGQYVTTQFVGVSGNGFSAGTTVGWHLGYEGFMVADDDTVFPLKDLCGPPCATLENVGKAYAGFCAVALILVALPAVGVVLSLIGCGVTDGMGSTLLVLVNTSFFCNFLATLLMLCGVAATVNGEGDDYRFTLIGDPDKFIPNTGAIANYVSILFYSIAICCLKREDVSGGGGGGGKGYGAQSRMYSGSAMRPAAGKKAKQHGKRPSVGAGKKRGGYV
ncbi:hypothetical protein TrST_g12781 [Triparma strigata]|uniref:Uncharacterized protein n=1 Tax=Triparma strigata TaxID=1606541 RepID=A0A9W7A3F6_9STRA|nr:hypothetical protein TrST_g12781 [Triparma strigata]